MQRIWTYLKYFSMEVVTNQVRIWIQLTRLMDVAKFFPMAIYTCTVTCMHVPSFLLSSISYRLVRTCILQTGRRAMTNAISMHPIDQPAGHQYVRVPKSIQSKSKSIRAWQSRDTATYCESCDTRILPPRAGPEFLWPGTKLKTGAPDINI